MIYEIPTYGLTVGSLAEVEKRYAEAYSVWPLTGGAEMLLTQTSKVVMPSTFSPMQ